VLFLTENKRLSVPHKSAGKRARLPRRESCSTRTHRAYPPQRFWLRCPTVVQGESRRPACLGPTRKARILHKPRRDNALASPLWRLPQRCHSQPRQIDRVRHVINHEGGERFGNIQLNVSSLFNGSTKIQALCLQSQNKGVPVWLGNNSDSCITGLEATAIK
jgi:hypothetical protein